MDCHLNLADNTAQNHTACHITGALKYEYSPSPLQLDLKLTFCTSHDRGKPMDSLSCLKETETKKRSWKLACHGNCS